MAMLEEQIQIIAGEYQGYMESAAEHKTAAERLQRAANVMQKRDPILAEELRKQATKEIEVHGHRAQDALTLKRTLLNEGRRDLMERAQKNIHPEEAAVMDWYYERVMYAENDAAERKARGDTPTRFDNSGSSGRPERTDRKQDGHKKRQDTRQTGKRPRLFSSADVLPGEALEAAPSQTPASETADSRFRGKDVSIT